MATHIPKPVTHIYKEINKGKFRSVQHFELKKTTQGESLLSDKINLSKNQNYALSMPLFWIKERINNKWAECLTGLFKTEFDNVFWGDVNKKQHLLLVHLSNDLETLTICYYKNFFTRDITRLIQSLKR